MLMKLRIMSANILTFFLALIPVFKSCPPCPICMPKYAALFAFFGLELADYSEYLIPVMVVCMLISLTSMGMQISKKELSWNPFCLAIFSCISLMICKYAIDIEWATYLMMFSLFISILWHYRNLNKSKSSSCCQTC